MNDFIRFTLSEYYEIYASDIKKLNMGHNECYIVSDELNKYFIKVLPLDEEKKLQNEMAYISFLSSKFCVPTIYMTKEKNRYIKTNHGLLLVEKYENGVVYDYNECPSTILIESAYLLGNLHMISKSYSGNRVIDYCWMTSYREKEIEEIHNLLEKVSYSESIISKKKIKEELELKLQMVTDTTQYLPLFKNVSYGMSHGDYCCPQWIVDNDNINCVIDFTNCAEIPYVWEVFRSYLQSSQSCNDGSFIDLNELLAYINAYNSKNKIDLSEWLIMPYIYVCWLSVSTYGYKQFLSNQNHTYLKIASWRTNICQTVLHNLNEIENAIKELFYE